ncbi:hypothetical protein Scep_008714 [Stephania cephalantha]|uniref:MADS-box domain-containing protein n=1 Tax=Stephania cephalantha TaxID=152367 RepID=A0AAP0JRQ0_9MAGN
MARKKVKLAWISNDSSRRATFKKRNKGLMKKVSELSTLCAVTACAIVFPPPPPTTTTNSHHQQPAEIWPSSASEVKRVIGRFAELPHMERTKRMMNQEGFLRHTASKLKEQVKRQQRENREQDVKLLMYQCLGGHKALHQLDSLKDLHCLGTSVDDIINQLYQRIDQLEFDYNTTTYDDDHHHQNTTTTTTTTPLINTTYDNHHDDDEATATTS